MVLEYVTFMCQEKSVSGLCVSKIDAESEMRERARPRESERPRVPFGDGQFERR